MLKNRYDEILIGLNLSSLIRSLVSCRRRNSVLLIDDPRFRVQPFSSLFLSELEIRSILRLGEVYDIPELSDIRNFLTPGEIKLNFGPKRLILGKGALSNLREVLRKFPHLVNESELNEILHTSETDFEGQFLSELKRYEEVLFEASKKGKSIRFEIQGPSWLQNFFKNFQTFLNQDYSQSKDLLGKSLLHLLGLVCEEKLKVRLEPQDIPFYFFRLLSPVYRLQDLFITTQLKRRLSLNGGDFKSSQVQYWQLDGQRFENLMLASFEGVITAKRVLFFSHAPQEVPFAIRGPYDFYREIDILPQRKALSPYPSNMLSLSTKLDDLGSEHPYRAVVEHEEGAQSYHWPYPEIPGSKPEFYRRDCEKSFQSDAQTQPFLMREPLFQEGAGVCLDMRKNPDLRKSPAQVLGRLPLEFKTQDNPIQGFEYWGPFRYRSLGFLALCYGVEGN
jgi:hypothetical protein